MTKPKLNLIIDALLLLCLGAIVGIGLLIKYVLVPGFQRREIYGGNVELLFWGMGRHEWGAVHLVLGYVFAGLLVLHVVLHWRVVVGIYCRLIPNRLLRYVTAAVLVAATVVLVGFSVLVKPDVQAGGHGAHGDHGERGGARGGRRQSGGHSRPANLQDKETGNGNRLDAKRTPGSGRRGGGRRDGRGDGRGRGAAEGGERRGD